MGPHARNWHGFRHFLGFRRSPLDARGRRVRICDSQSAKCNLAPPRAKARRNERTWDSRTACGATIAGSTATSNCPVAVNCR